MKHMTWVMTPGLLVMMATGLAPRAVDAQADPAFGVTLQVGSFVPLGSFKNAGGTAELATAQVWGLEVRHALVSPWIGLAVRADVTKSVSVNYTVAPDCSQCYGPSVNAFHAALDLDVRTKAHHGFRAYLQAGPAVRELAQLGGSYDASLIAQLTDAPIGMLHVNTGVEHALGRLGINLQLGAYSGRFNHSLVADYIATAGIRF